MPDLTLKRMDAAIRRVWQNPDAEVFEADRAIFIAGMKAAEKISQDAGMDKDGDEAFAIRATVARLRKEAKANG